MVNRVKTLLCVSIAGILFLTAVLFNKPFLFIIGGIIDWLPLPARWMKSEGEKKPSLKAIIAHALITAIAYAFGVTWFVGAIVKFPVKALFLFKALFIETWWVAVMAGVYVTYSTF